jgi:hypothetical protein
MAPKNAQNRLLARAARNQGAAFILFLLVTGPGQLAGQTTASIEGIVYDPSGSAITGASVSLRELATGNERLVRTDDRGWYAAPALSPGLYDMTVAGDGFRTEVRRSLELQAGRNARLDFHLSLGERHQTVEVKAQALMLSPTTADWGGSIPQENLEQMPLDGRDLFDLSAQQAGAIVTTTATVAISSGEGTHVSFNGARPNQNSFRLDGIYINDWSGSAPSSSAGHLLGLEGTQELRLLTSPFSAEYGRAAGSVVTAVSRSGSNDLHGELYEYFRNSAMDAKNFFDAANAPIPPLRRNQFGAVLGGPLRRDRLFFFTNYEGLRENSDATVNATTLSDEGRQGHLGSTTVTVAPQVLPYIALYPKANGRDYGDGTAQYITDTSTGTREDYLSAKLDYDISDKLRTAVRYTFDDARMASPDPFRIWNFVEDSRYDFIHTETHFLESPNTVHTLHAGFSRILSAELNEVDSSVPAADSFVPGQPLGSITVTGLTALGGYRARLPRWFVDNDYQLSYDAVTIRGAHTLKFGAGFDRIQFNQLADLSAVGGYTFYSVKSFLQAQPASGDLMVPGSNTDRGWRQNQMQVFAQDEWQATRRLNITLGLRYEPYSVPSEAHGMISTLPDPVHDTSPTLGGPLFNNPSWSNVAPRAAIAWDPAGDGKTVVRAGAGIFYDQLGIPELVITGNRMPPYYVRLLPNNPAFPNIVSAVAKSAPPMSLDTVDYHENQPYTAQYQFAVERAFAGDTVVRLGYAGSRGVHLPGQLGNVNPPNPAIDANGVMYFPANSPRLNPAWGTIGMRRTQFDSHYNALQASLERKWRRARVEVHYAWSRSIDDISNAIFNDFGNSNVMPTMFDYQLNRGLSDFDARHVFTANTSYALPALGRSALARALGGWEAYAMVQAHTGFPFSPDVGFDDARLGGGGSDLGQRPNYLGSVGAPITGDPAQYFNPLAFGLPAAGYYGNLGRNALTGPGTVDVDAALHKILWRTERQTLRLRLEAFNIANHPNFQIPSGLALFDSTGRRLATAGQITATSTPSRQIQLAMKWAF